ncbi:MAG: sn-glycerol-3-phosphate ABC transporter ATP-binding protein UgpC [Beijerinckiaceae bacterium]|nr:sn-glycerol-3-phosphate ABC transporter ATP-binding protein UgpC [Beijerinckiaceae bacterium]
MADIAIRNVEKSYSKTAVLHGINLEIIDGEFLVILGPSGCGKSTLLRMIAGLEGITRGEIAIGGRVVNALEPRERGCAMVFQNYALYPHMTVGENIGYALKVAGLPKVERERRVAEIAQIVGLEAFLARRPSELSGGQRQRVAMGRAMIREPKVFLFDEPLSNLDAKLRVQMRLEIRRLHQRLKATSVFVTHDQIEAMSLADRIVVMNQGRIEQAGPPRQLYAEPATRFVASFLGAPAMNLLPATIVAKDRARMADGTEIALDPGRFVVEIGQAVEIGIRPEDVMIVWPGSEGAHALEVEFTEDMGSSRLIHTRLGGMEFTVLQPTAQIEAQSTLHINLPENVIHLFDARTGSRLIRAGATIGTLASAAA